MAEGVMQHVFKAVSACSSSVIPYPQLFGAEFIALEANLVSNFSLNVPAIYYPGHPGVNATNIEFCNITLTHTHPGYNDYIQTQIYLPTRNWNSRMQGAGGGGWMAGMYNYTDLTMIGAVSDGYAAVTTDGGHKSFSPADWALSSPGNVNLYAFQNFASVSLADAAFIGKDIIKSFYGRRPKYSYWDGCSQGGRQGLMLAQRYPTAYDGIHASAPAIYSTQLLVGDHWPQQIMNEIGEFPYPCELDFITASAVAACDEDDGVVDGVIAFPESCDFDPMTLVGEAIACPESEKSTVKLSQAAAIVAKAAWGGARKSDGSFLWYGLNKDAKLTGDLGLASTNCSRDGKCSQPSFSISADWIRLFLKKDPSFDVNSLSRNDYEAMFHASVQQYSSIIGTDDPDLSEFRKAGGKMVTFHGLADNLIPPSGSERYYNSVRALDPDVANFYRYFEAPGLAHCGQGKGAAPNRIFESLVAWVENGTLPKALVGEIQSEDGYKTKRRLLCPYPSKAWFDGKGDPDLESSYTCA